MSDELLEKFGWPGDGYVCKSLHREYVAMCVDCQVVEIAELESLVSEQQRKIDHLSEGLALVGSITDLWTDMQKDGVNRVFPEADGWYEVLYPKGLIQVVEWPDAGMVWMIARYFKPWLPPLPDGETE